MIPKFRCFCSFLTILLFVNSGIVSAHKPISPEDECNNYNANTVYKSAFVYHEGVCYQAGAGQFQWLQTKLLCMQLQPFAFLKNTGSLVSVKSSETFSAVVNKVYEKTNDQRWQCECPSAHRYIWVGAYADNDTNWRRLSKQERMNRFRWIDDQSAVDSDVWHSSQPDNNYNPELCAAYQCREKVGLHDRCCPKLASAFICQYPTTACKNDRETNVVWPTNEEWTKSDTTLTLKCKTGETIEGNGADCIQTITCSNGVWSSKIKPCRAGERTNYASSTSDPSKAKKQTKLPNWIIYLIIFLVLAVLLGVFCFVTFLCMAAGNNKQRRQHNHQQRHYNTNRHYRDRHYGHY